jgi:hypothetical protein
MESERTMALGRLLFSHARGIVKSDDWMTGARGGEQLQDRIRQMNRLFLAGSKLEPLMRYCAWVNSPIAGGSSRNSSPVVNHRGFL